MIMEKDSQVVGDKREKIKSLVSKAKKESSDDETSTSESKGEEYVMVVRNFRKFIRRRGKFVKQSRDEKKSLQRNKENNHEKDERKCFRCGDPNHFIEECSKLPKCKDKKAFGGGTWSDNDNEKEEKTNDEICLMATHQM
ncbi:zf-CCHC domain-containing protein, partial [Tanacetum coccineum]